MSENERPSSEKAAMAAGVYPKQFGQFRRSASDKDLREEIGRLDALEGEGIKDARAIFLFELGNRQYGIATGGSGVDLIGAVASYKGCIDLFPRWPEAYFNRGLVEVKIEMFRDAIFDLDRAGELWSLEMVLWPVGRNANLLGQLELGRARSLLGLSRQEEALEAIQRSQVHFADSETGDASRWFSLTFETLVSIRRQQRSGQ